MRTGIDRLVPTRLLDGDPDERRRARLLVASIALSGVGSLFGFAQYQALGHVERAWFSLAVSVPLIGILAVFRKTGSLALAGHAMLLLIACAIWRSSQIAADGPTVLLAVSVLGLSAAHVIGPVAGFVWTAIAVALGTTNALLLSDPQLSALAWTATILAGLFGAAGVAIESQRRQAFVAVQGENDRLRSLGESAFQWVLETRGSRIDYVSPEIEEGLGFTPDQVLGRRLARFIHREDLARFAASVNRNSGAATRSEHRSRNADGDWVWVESIAVQRPEAGEDRWLYASRVIDAERQDRERLARAEKLEGVATLAAGVAHDFNNLLTVIDGHAEFMPKGESREEIRAATRRASGLTQQLLAFGREQPVARETLDWCQVVRDLEPILRSLLGEGTDLRIRATGPHWVKGGRSQLEQIVVNLVTNARDATRGRGRVEVELAPARDTDGRSLVSLRVHDDGIGMSEETRRQAFDPFFSTKSRDRGTGLGLASVHGLVSQLEGDIELESTPGRGTMALVRIPRAEEPARRQAPPEPIRIESAQGERVVVVEDDPAIRSLLRRYLADLGYQVWVTGSGDQAIQRQQEDPAVCDLLVTDVVMPGLRGPEVAESLRAQNPGLKVLFISGYSNDELGDWQERRDGVDFLAKPFTRRELAERASVLLQT